ncbi:hypothetical protein NC653_017916 [Populus alba x Populus x berolinensis]|uniref:Uncharacterized protein n=1 Tax=Populus alba x Populus x berolinensis TaxID=444605 RepID=A0AAD6W145_9ROSI|nr:hypothetical protein NC653_017916 [Populus alba x Populus x berolinensis]
MRRAPISSHPQRCQKRGGGLEPFERGPGSSGQATVPSPFGILFFSPAPERRRGFSIFFFLNCRTQQQTFSAGSLPLSQPAPPFPFLPFFPFHQQIQRLHPKPHKSSPFSSKTEPFPTSSSPKPSTTTATNQLPLHRPTLLSSSPSPDKPRAASSSPLISSAAAGQRTEPITAAAELLQHTETPPLTADLPSTKPPICRRSPQHHHRSPHD